LGAECAELLESERKEHLGERERMAVKLKEPARMRDWVMVTLQPSFPTSNLPSPQCPCFYCYILSWYVIETKEPVYAPVALDAKDRETDVANVDNM
jgi:hypothetical protein